LPLAQQKERMKRKRRRRRRMKKKRGSEDTCARSLRRPPSRLLPVKHRTRKGGMYGGRREGKKERRCMNKSYSILNPIPY